MNQKKESPKIGHLRKDLRMFRSSDSAEKSGACWVVLDPTNGQYFRIYDTEYKILTGLNNKDYTLDEYLDYLNNNLLLHVTKEELVKTILFLRSNSLMLPEFIEAENRIEKLRLYKKNAWFSKLMAAYLFFKIPIWKPDKFLDKTVDLVKSIFNKWVVLFLCIISGIGYGLIVVNWTRFIYTIEGTLNYSGLIRYAIVVVIIKFFHELAHAYAAKMEGVRVRYIGVGIVFFFPRFYTDLTDSWRISDNKKRAFMDAAGILLELVIGGIAAFFWINSTPGLFSTLAYYLFTTSIINTLLINGNPMIRYDGYYLLADLFNTDNLQSKSLNLWERVFDRIIFGIKLTKQEILNHFGKNYIFVLLYGVAAFFYRIFLYTGIVLIVYFKFTKALGIFLALMEIQVLFIRPILIQYKRMKLVKQQAKKKHTVISTITIIVIVLIFLIPMPWNIPLPCIVQPSKFSVIYVPEDAFFKKLDVKDGSTVRKGELLATFENPFMDWSLEENKLWLKEGEIELDQVRSNPEKLDMVKLKMEQNDNLRDDIAELERKKASLSIHAPFDGVFYLKDRNLNSGKRMAKGELFGFVKDTSSPIIMAFVRENDVNKIDVGDKASITLSNKLLSYKGKVESVDKVPFVDWTPSPLLDTFGGPIQVINVEQYLFKPKERYYCIKITPAPSSMDIPVGRTGTANIRVYKSLTFSLIKKVVSSLQKELTF